MTIKLEFIAWELTALTEVNMEMRIEPYNTHQLDAVIHLSLRAWSPVFDSIAKVMDIDIYREFYHDN